MYEGDKISDKNYAVAGDILDGYLYDLFMQMLEERGVNSEFADNLSEWCSAHEHSQYINLLQGCRPKYIFSMVKIITDNFTLFPFQFFFFGRGG